MAKDRELGRKRRNSNDNRVESKAERQVHDHPGRDRDGVVAPASDGNWRRTRVGAVLQRNAVVNGPGEERAEQDDRAEVAVGDSMRQGPQLDDAQHWTLEAAFILPGT